ncbi:MAG: hypothetical protein H7A52_11940 [Akkermansiaceae bacterium]|nr:hypothetical protein [Akkermansiaceae bacterium]
MARRGLWLPAIFLALTGASGAETPPRAVRASEAFDWPPVLAREWGNPVIEWGAAPAAGFSLRRRRNGSGPPSRPRGLRSFGSGTNSAFPLRLRVSGNAVAAARAVLERVWALDFSDNRADAEWIDLDRERFLRVGTGYLTGHIVSDPVGNAWWRVRMGYPQTVDPDYHWIVITTHSDTRATPYGHFAMGLRRRGGTDPAHDLVFDPRAPWDKDELPAIGDWINRDNSHVNHIEARNLWDWMHTQTHYRGLGMRMRFLPISTDQVVLMKALAARDGGEDRGPFRAFRNNCATIGVDLIDGMLPLDAKFRAWHPVADIPTRIARLASREFGEVAFVEIFSEVEALGREPSAKSFIRPAPDRRALSGYRVVLAVPEIN